MVPENTTAADVGLTWGLDVNASLPSFPPKRRIRLKELMSKSHVYATDCCHNSCVYLNLARY